MSDRVQVTKAMIGITAMQVCAVNDATDEEILKVCEMENPCGTRKGWLTVIRKVDKENDIEENCLPVQCGDNKDRTHFLIMC